MTLGIVLWIIMLFVAMSTPDESLRKQRLLLLALLFVLALLLRLFHVQL